MGQGFRSPRDSACRLPCGSLLLGDLLRIHTAIALRRDFPGHLSNFNGTRGKVFATRGFGCSVLVLLDLSYQSRFWTQYELWLSLQKGTADGLVPAEASESRSHVETIHSGTQDLAESLKKMWRAKNTDQARATLSARDVKVTNQSDKDIHLTKLRVLNQSVMHACDKAQEETKC